jgi:hypothetical protein
MATNLKLLDINGLAKLWGYNKEYVGDSFDKKIFVGTYGEYMEVESQLEAGALVIILDEVVPNEYIKLVTDENDFYTAKGEMFVLRKN